MTVLSHPNKYGEMYPTHLLAKKLNNRACRLIIVTTRKARAGAIRGSGNKSCCFNESIALLMKAFKLTEHDISMNNNIHNNDKVPCICEFCCLDSCLTTNNSSHERNNKNPIVNSVGLSGSGTTHLGEKQQQQQQQQHDHDQHHYMGVTLSIVILFNLALVHHLKAISMIEEEKEDNNNEIETTTSSYSLIMTELYIATKLYELSYELQCREHVRIETIPVSNNNVSNNNNYVNNMNKQHLTNLRFLIIITNNLGEIHRVIGNQKKYTMCLQHLLSCIMYIVDNNRNNFDISGSKSLVHILLDSTEFVEGVIRNISSIVVTTISASAA
ncbi:hypothetical protein FRACYDRAFT_240728 [Fragilariopsis cylindrus CCMP1102]|uniref:Uncharacterized protein n=1 Tax=Fragilariopsis cylindrus CCMP1102 TaxID=635003 RepID=A0A1E7F873_9STRA|nr:hypothetical protein FRACYDRAFT_240728 [Fragilariopsis cylindrus CCMP1102]|eukprot:OEU14195.1 hypothetical protein FRACYDRAFT_240728 [Fragilariopsis cylindrus CCMP1102]